MSDDNTGNCNTGNWNTGNCNTGNCNTGNWNTGDWNTGDCNTGHRNTGNSNTGDWNTGDWNTGDCNTGFFCEETPMASFFDAPTSLTHESAREIVNDLPWDLIPVGAEWIKSSDMSDAEKAANPAHSTTGGYLKKHTLPFKESMPIAWAKFTPEQRQKFLDLPNFNADKFLRMFGVDVRKPAAKTVRVRLAGGEVVSGTVID